MHREDSASDLMLNLISENGYGNSTRQTQLWAFARHNGPIVDGEDRH